MDQAEPVPPSGEGDQVTLKITQVCPAGIRLNPYLHQGMGDQVTL